MGGTRRAGQETMVRETCAAIASGEHLMVQAGTGTGKSMGYLVPALTAAALGDTRALVSTATLALQRQILVKDAPAVVEAVGRVCGRRPKVALFKGWSNYLCVHRLGGGYPDEDPAPGLFGAPSPAARAGRSPVRTGGARGGEGAAASHLAEEVLRLREWAATTATGDRDDLVPGTSERAWRQVSVQKRECLSKACPAFAECFPQAAREQVIAADLVVTNHSLLGIAATGQGDLFGEIDLVIVDEAHELASRVREQASVSVSAVSLSRASRTARRHGKVDTSTLDAASDALVLAVQALPAGLLEERPDPLDAAVRTLDAAVRDALGQVHSSEVDTASKALARSALDELAALGEAWNRDTEQSITWVEQPEADGVGTLELVVAPLDVAPAIGTQALGERPAVLTSATLALGESFDAIARECGLMVCAVPWRGIDVGTPFDPARQGILYVAEHLPPPGIQGPTPQSLDLLVELVRVSGGGALVLFSSWKGAEAGAEHLRAHTDLEILMQGEEGMAALVQQFRDRRDSVLVGTLGLWQGVDVPGPACRLVVIDRIPFPHPDSPVVRARTKDAEKRRMSGFWTVSLTHAALMLAQGAGRLIRSAADRGVVAILDKRLTTKSYGSFLRASLPPMWPTSRTEVVLEALRRLRKDLDGEGKMS
ncbi:ATP-dependent DNA helicase [Schaalia sp. 19OD2882]|nr:ATP-dependent DNA helicase [Schaalia sp. 19OD2882]QWW20703.1 ATP-dependent DNA helicase [Schaalia sp. 19OD2882]